MYQPPAFREDRIEVQHQLIRAHPLALLITAGPTGLLANLFPFLLDSRAPTKAHCGFTSRGPIRNGANSNP